MVELDKIEMILKAIGVTTANMDPQDDPIINTETVSTQDINSYIQAKYSRGSIHLDNCGDLTTSMHHKNNKVTMIVSQHTIQPTTKTHNQAASNYKLLHYEM